MSEERFDTPTLNAGMDISVKPDGDKYAVRIILRGVLQGAPRFATKGEADRVADEMRQKVLQVRAQFQPVRAR
ncbi:hypothetical protein BA190_24030 [Labrys sp. WJW]|uniref:hypothetical protein n=1 Tax=Labrys sp. WJW TaxID=1737983 RepID=UPI00082ACE9A|nr:hypothetical protein [Labrys sp. WJW]OCC02397.1 hypothetical protein BA190_24030 [Labrys sp. WJW]